MQDRILQGEILQGGILQKKPRIDESAKNWKAEPSKILKSKEIHLDDLGVPFLAVEPDVVVSTSLHTAGFS